MSVDSALARFTGKRSVAVRAGSAAALLAITVIAVADPPVAPSPSDARVARVRLGDLDLATAQGTRVALKRVTAAAQRLCFQLGDDARASNRATVSACVRDTVADTMKTIDLPRVAALSPKP
jgi:UrcA family protein